jgi:hypothetical protein
MPDPVVNATGVSFRDPAGFGASSPQFQSACPPDVPARARWLRTGLQGVDGSEGILVVTDLQRLLTS